MHSIYHLVPKEMVGTRLIPLNRMKQSNLGLYLKEASKYRGREKLLERHIPKINCLWNDVLHFSSISPDIIFSRFESLGFGKYEGLRWFEVPLSHLEGLASVIYRAPQKPRPNFALDDDDIEFLNIGTYQEPKGLSDQAEAYFLHCQKEGKTPLPFQFTSHILVYGEFETKGLKIVSR